MRFPRLVTSFFVGCIGIAFHSNKSSITVPEEEKEEKSSATDHSRIRLSDGRYLAYKERGVPKNKSDYRVIIIHGFGSSKDMNFMVSQELMDELKIYLLLYDRAGYGESDPHPNRTIKSEASDIQQLADEMDLGPKFYVIAVSLGSYPAWSCLKTIPQRLGGVAMVVPMINYNWPSLPKHLIEDDFRRNLSRWMLMAANHTPRLLHWWLTQKWLPSSINIMGENPTFFSNKDLEVLKNTPGYKLLSKDKLQKKGAFDSIRRDFIVAFSKWDFDPLALTNPFLQKDKEKCSSSSSSVHIWQGCEDKVVPMELQRFVSQKLPWVKYHEVTHGGHMLVYDKATCEVILRTLLLGEEDSHFSYKPDAAPCN